jgi:peptide/nickel transport system ATP-binding protein
MSEILKLEDVNYSVQSGSSLKQILKGINLSISQNEIIGISGESGSGKTTLAKIIADIIKPSGGKVIFTSQNNYGKKSRTNPIQILFQNNGEILNPLREIDKIVKEAIITADKTIQPQQRMEEIFKSINFPESLWGRKGYELSGGEQQRAALARLLAVNPELLILDEPFSAQDPESQLNLLNLFLSLNKTYNISMICIAHNLKILRKLCTEVLILYNGEIIEHDKTEVIFNLPKHPYTKFLLKAENYNLSYEELKCEKEQS